MPEQGYETNVIDRGFIASMLGAMASDAEKADLQDTAELLRYAKKAIEQKEEAWAVKQVRRIVAMFG